MIDVLHGDCRVVVPALGRKFQLGFADPPFGIGEQYSGFDDRFTNEEFEEFTFDWLSAILPTIEGVLCLHGPDRLAELYLRFARERQLPRIAWILWHYRFGQCGRGNWINSHAHCLIYSTVPQYTWNPDAVLVESDRVGYEDSRVHETERGGSRLPFTVWSGENDGPYWGRVQGNSAERCAGRPNQLPEVYLERIIRAYTNVGDSVLDPFGGTGTTAVVASTLRRRCVTCDIDVAAVETIRQRIEKGSVRINA